MSFRARAAVLRSPVTAAVAAAGLVTAVLIAWIVLQPHQTYPAISLPLVPGADRAVPVLHRGQVHDGAQQQLVALAVHLRLTDSLIDDDPAGAHAALRDLQAQAGEAARDLRELAHGIYPPLLADRGLPDALAAQARRSPVPVITEARSVGRYSPDIEAAVYFCCLEALQNVAKYASAASARVRVSAVNSHLSFEVTDDGRGFDPAATAHGTGLQGMADRLEALGGSIEIRSLPGQGTTIAGRIPV